MLSFRSPRSLFALTLAVLLLPAAASAAPITFDFNDVPRNGSNAAAQASMQSVLSAARIGGTVTVTGALGLTDYDGDGHVVGAVDGRTVTPYTLGTTDGGVAHAGFDAFLANRVENDRIVMTFSFPIYAVAFDYQIFPDASGAASDFSFRADGNLMLFMLGVAPANSGGFLHSPVSGPDAVEQVPQYLGSAAFTFPGGVTKLEFIDWPERIGIDNLKIDSGLTPAAVPEPSGVVVWLGCFAGLGVVGLWLRRRRRCAAAVAD